MCSAIHVLNNYHNNNSNKNWIWSEHGRAGGVGHKKKCCTWKKFWERKKNLHELIVCCCRSISLAKYLLLLRWLFFFLSFYFSTCTSLSLLSSSTSVRKSVRHPFYLFHSRCMYFSKCCCSSSPSSPSRSSLFWYDLHIPPITSPLVYITILCNAPSFLHRTCRACTWTCNDKFYWKVSLTRIFISSSSFTVAIANNLPSI